MNPNVSRRHFIKLSLTTLSACGLSPFIKGCTRNQPVAEPRPVATIELDSHPAIPTPEAQCYLGWHHDIGYRISGTVDYWLKEKSAQAEAHILGIYKNKIGSLPAVHSIADDFLGASYYPAGVLDAAVKMGVFPMMRYFPHTNWERISRGDYDHHLQRFSQQVSKAALPAFFIPFPGAGHFAGDHPWKDCNPEFFIPAWNRMFKVFEQQGANRYLVWGLHLASRSSGFVRKRQYFQVPTDQVDWVGVSVWNQTISRSEPFLRLLGDDYSELTALYKTKPFAIWELADRHRGSDWFYRYSSKWFERTFTAIKSLPRCKLVVFFDFRWYHQDLENELLEKRNIAMIQQITKGGYFLTGGRNAAPK